jgi:hypothetical protein
MEIEKEIKRYTAKQFYGYVKIDLTLDGSFNFKSMAYWPDPFDGKTYENSICDGIREALSEYGYSTPIGSYVLKEIKISEKIDESVPIAYYWAAKSAIKEYLHGLDANIPPIILS